MPRGVDWLSPAEAGRLAGMRFTKRRTEYLLRRWAGKLAVAAVTDRPVDPPSLRAVELLNRSSGAPQAWVDGRPLGLEVSLTDRAGWAVCLIGDSGGNVGVDLELVEPRTPGFVRDFLTPSEQRYVADRPEGPDRDAAANLLWSAKESALKVLQVGLRADTRTVEVGVGHAADGAGWSPLHIRVRPPSSRDPGLSRQGRPAPTGRVLPGWWRRDGVFLLTVAADRPVPPPSPLPRDGGLAAAVPVHSWLSNPLPE
jgi:4'-phosphopantetheinyl transferase